MIDTRTNIVTLDMTELHGQYCFLLDSVRVGHSISGPPWTDTDNMASFLWLGGLMGRVEGKLFDFKIEIKSPI